MKQKLFFKNSKGDKLCGILSNPASSKEKPIIILCHGFSTSKDAQTYIKLEHILNKKEISTFRFDFYGHGESDGKFENITISEAVDDALRAIDFIKVLGFKKIGLFGSSFGGMASIMTASKSKELFVLALKSPASNYMGKLLVQRSKQEIDKWKKKGFIYYEREPEDKLKLKYSFYEDSIKTDGYEAAKNIEIPTIIVHGDLDKSVPVEQSIRTSSLIKNCRLEIVKGSDHRYTNPKHFKKMLKLISGFIFENC